jgi:hypothetical protein
MIRAKFDTVLENASKVGAQLPWRCQLPPST